MERSNEVSGVDIDRFIGVAENSPVHLSHGTLLTHSILGAGDPYNPGPSRAVLEYRKDLSIATLLAWNRTPLSTLQDQFFFYVKSGQGTLDDGKMYWDLREGIAILAPPNVPHRFINTSDKPLTMVMVTWTSQSATPGTALVVRDTALLPYCEENVHWNNTSKCIFSTADGLVQGERMFIVMLQPRAMSAPHTHGPGTEEIWTKLTPGTAVTLLGSEIRDMPENSAYLVPPTGFTQHGNLNLSQDRVDWWLYVARGAQGGGGRGGGPTTANAPSPAGGANTNANAGGRGANPNVVRDRAAVEAANVAGKPLKQ
jgi:mannose-6-phosphate isomerase-like protein (cupin superfamily)